VASVVLYFVLKESVKENAVGSVVFCESHCIFVVFVIPNGTKAEEQ